MLSIKIINLYSLQIFIIIPTLKTETNIFTSVDRNATAQLYFQCFLFSPLHIFGTVQYMYNCTYKRNTEQTIPMQTETITKLLYSPQFTYFNMHYPPAYKLQHLQIRIFALALLQELMPSPSLKRCYLKLLSFKGTIVRIFSLSWVHSFRRFGTYTLSDKDLESLQCSIIWKILKEIVIFSRIFMCCFPSFSESGEFPEVWCKRGFCELPSAMARLS